MHASPRSLDRRRRVGVAIAALAVAATTVATAVPAVAAPVGTTSRPGVAVQLPDGSTRLTVDGPLTITVDPKLVRPDGAGVIVGPDGQPAAFTTGRVVVHDANTVGQLLETVKGEVLDTVDPSPAGLEDVASVALVRVAPRSVEADAVVDDLTAIAGDAAHGAHRVSDDAALATLAVAAHARRTGLAVDLDWIPSADTVRTSSTTEAPATAPPGVGGYSPDAFAWPSLLVIRAPEAWNLLARAGRMTPNSVAVAVLDQGFNPVDADRPAGGFSDAPGLGPGVTATGARVPQHGARVASALSAIPDNSFGGAGAAGPVARPLLFDRGGDVFSDIGAAVRAATSGARIINMSFSMTVPAVVAPLIAGYDFFTMGLRANGILQFASAGNAGFDVDGLSCALACWESSFVSPCENRGVVCVGGLAGGGSTAPHTSSNFGSGGLDPMATVRLWADFCTFAGPDLLVPGNVAQPVCGTSFAAPHTAGTAALVQAADPRVSTATVESTLLTTARPGSCLVTGRCARRIVDAAAGVAATLGNQPPDVSIQTSAPSSAARGTPVEFVAIASDPDGPTPTVDWQVDGVTVATGTTYTSSFHDQPFGTHTVSARVTDGTWTVTDAQGGIPLTLTNTAPTVAVTSPANGSTVATAGVPRPCRSSFAGFECPDDIVLTATSTDRNDNPPQLPDVNVTWFLDGSSTAFASGHSPAPLKASSLSLGVHTITVHGTDTTDATLVGTATITFEVTRATPFVP
jgi:hypothetical protein